jgi:PAS domain S-box-containing protein
VELWPISEIVSVVAGDSSGERSDVLAALGKTGERFRMIINGVGEYGISMLELDGRIATWNAGAERMDGYLASEIIGKPLAILFTPEDQAAGRPAFLLEKARLDGSSLDEAWRVRKDGGRYWAVVSNTALRDESGAVVGFTRIARDSTARRQSENERTNLLADFEEALRVRDEFLSIASHELKTPLTPLYLSIQALLRRSEGNGGRADVSVPRDQLERIERQIHRVAQLVDNLFDISRISAGKLEVTPTSGVDLVAIARELAQRFEPELKRAKCDLRLDAPGPVIGRFDRMRVEQILSNLISNAIKYGDCKPIDLRISREPGGIARISVRDKGIGIKPEDQARIFERFERAVPKAHYGGFGLGLWITRQIVEAHGGTIRVVSVAGAGSEFIVDLPMGT